jgi:hypothetical protein
MTAVKHKPIQRDWVAKTLAGTLLGFTLAIGCSALFAWLNQDMAMSIKVQLTMWIVAPIWLATLSASYLFASGWRAWLWLGGLNLLVFSTLIMTSLFSS